MGTELECVKWWSSNLAAFLLILFVSLSAGDANKPARGKQLSDQDFRGVFTPSHLIADMQDHNFLISIILNKTAYVLKRNY